MAASPEEKPWTLLELLNWTTAYLARGGVEDPRLNAQILLAEAAGVERIMLYARFDQELAADRRRRFHELVKRRSERCPLQYLLGRCEFYSRNFKVTPAVMAPRQETELLVEKCLDKLPGDGSGANAADIGTGSGVIAVTLACERPGLRICAVDASADALQVAGRNAEAHGVSDRVAMACGDLCGALPEGMRQGLALLAANPPYIPSERIKDLEPEVRDHEPRLALDGGPDGLAVVRRLLPQAAGALAEGGWLVLELGEDQATKVADMIRGMAMMDADSIETVRDNGCERVLAVCKCRA